MRKDTQHNFSFWFYILRWFDAQHYAPSTMKLIGISAFLPQLALCVYSSCKYADYPYIAAFFGTFWFVAFNKVCTVQYFVWYFTFLPLLAPIVVKRAKMLVFLALVWAVSQLVWLQTAYRFEFLKEDNLVHVWYCSLNFVVVNTAIGVYLNRLVSKNIGDLCKCGEFPARIAIQRAKKKE